MNAPDVAPVSRRLQQPMLNAYADASGDHNPIHIDEAFAKTTQMGGTIAHGMLVLSFISEMMAGAFGKRWLESGSLEVRFRNPARPGDTVTASATPHTSAASSHHRTSGEIVWKTPTAIPEKITAGLNARFSTIRSRVCSTFFHLRSVVRARHRPVPSARTRDVQPSGIHTMQR